jgi:amino acid transporter
MGRIGAFPRFLAQVHPRHHSPALAILTGFVITVGVTLGLGLGYGPTTAFVMVATALVIVLAAIYIVMNAACIGYFTRHRARGRFNPLLHLVIPVLGIVTFIPAWLTSAGIKAFSFVAPLSPPYSYLGPGVAGWMAAGVIYLVYLYRHDPRRVVEVGLVHLDDPVEE